MLEAVVRVLVFRLLELWVMGFFRGRVVQAAGDGMFVPARNHEAKNVFSCNIGSRLFLEMY